MNPQQAERARAAIKTTQIVKRLRNFVLQQKDDQGNLVEMTATQVTAALGLLRKTLPDLAQVSGTMNVSVADPHELEDAELAVIATGGGALLAIEADRTAEPDQVH